MEMPDGSGYIVCMDKHPKRPRDSSQLAKLMIDLATGEAPESPNKEKDPAAVKRGRAGGAKGGKARAKKLTPAERQEQAQKAARTRWGKE